MLRIASDAASIRHLLQTLAQERQGEPGSPRLPTRHSSRASLLPHDGPGASSSSGGGSEDGEAGGRLGPSLGKSPFDASPLGSGLSKLSPAGASGDGGPIQLSPASSTEASDVPADGAGKAAAGATPVLHRR